MRNDDFVDPKGIIQQRLLTADFNATTAVHLIACYSYWRKEDSTQYS